MDEIYNLLLKQLKIAQIARPIFELRIMIAHLKQVSYTAVWLDQSLSPSKQAILNTWVQRRCNLEPLAKILEFQEFYGRGFKTTCHTLDPRRETEHLIEVLENLRSMLPEDFLFLDMGCGSGCLMITILLEHPKSRGLGIDLCPKALAVAKTNLQTYDAATDRGLLIASDWWSCLRPFFHKKNEAKTAYDLIVSNPPYIDETYLLDRQTLYDPKHALFAPNKGLSFYERIMNEGKQFLKPGGLLIIEIGIGQKDAVHQLGINQGWILHQTVNDYQNIPRIMVFLG